MVSPITVGFPSPLARQYMWSLSYSSILTISPSMNLSSLPTSIILKPFCTILPNLTLTFPWRESSLWQQTERQTTTALLWILWTIKPLKNGLNIILPPAKGKILSAHQTTPWIYLKNTKKDKKNSHRIMVLKEKYGRLQPIKKQNIFFSTII